MRSQVMKECKRLTAKSYRADQIALTLGITEEQVQYALSDQRKANGGQEKKGSPDDIVDGERIEDRIKDMTARIRAGVLVIPRADR